MQHHPPQNDALIAALQKASHASDTNREEVLEALHEALLLIPLEAPPEEHDEEINFHPLVLEKEGHLSLLAFTDIDAAHRFTHPQTGQAVDRIDMSAVLLCQMAEDLIESGAPVDSVVINPAGPVSFELSPAEIESLAGGRLPADEQHLVVEHEADIYIGIPDPRPSDDLLNELRDAVTKSGVREAYWFCLAMDDEEPHLALAIHPSNAAIVDAVYLAVEPVLTAHGISHSEFELLGLDRSTSLSRTICETAEVLYQADEGASKRSGKRRS